MQLQFDQVAAEEETEDKKDEKLKKRRRQIRTSQSALSLAAGSATGGTKLTHDE
jgi:hypothetical protein